MVSMDWIVFVILYVLLQPSASAVLFTVDVEQDTYISEFGETVVMGCIFRPISAQNVSDLKIRWYREGSKSLDVYETDKGVVSEEYRGRAVLLSEELKQGRSRLQLSNLRISDSGKYVCIVKSESGNDYKKVTLSVTAPYRSVSKHVERAIASGADDVLLTCQSEGYPASPVSWQNSRRRSLKPNTTTVETSDQLFKVTSQIRVSSSLENNYTCVFTNNGHSAAFQLPEELPVLLAKNDALIIILCFGLTVVAIAVVVVVYRRRKGMSSGARNVAAYGGRRLTSALTTVTTED